MSTILDVASAIERVNAKISQQALGLSVCCGEDRAMAFLQAVADDLEHKRQAAVSADLDCAPVMQELPY